MVGDREELAAGRSFHRHDAADVGVERALGAVGEDVQPLLARGIAYRDEATIAEPAPMAEAHRIGRAVLAHGTFPEREGEELAAHTRDQAVAFGVKRIVTEKLSRWHESARRLRAVRPDFDLQAPRLVARRVVEPQVGRALIDDAPAIGCRVAGVIVLVVGMAAQIRAVGRA